MKTFEVVVENRGGHDGSATGGHYGSWARVWVSNPEVAVARVKEDRHEFTEGRLSTHHDFIVVEVELQSSFDEENDFLLVEHKRSPNPFLNGSSSREYYELLAGTMPAWASFPEKWRDWVDDVRWDAIEYIRKRVPQASEDISFALRKASKGNIIYGWGRGCRDL